MNKLIFTTKMVVKQNNKVYGGDFGGVHPYNTIRNPYDTNNRYYYKVCSSLDNGYIKLLWDNNTNQMSCKHLKLSEKERNILLNFIQTKNLTLSHISDVKVVNNYMIIKTSYEYYLISLDDLSCIYYSFMCAADKHSVITTLNVIYSIYKDADEVKNDIKQYFKTTYDMDVSIIGYQYDGGLTLRIKIKKHLTTDEILHDVDNLKQFGTLETDIAKFN